MRLLDGEFYFMRHGTTESNEAGRIAGFTDEPLTARGRALAERQAQKLDGIPLGSLWVSTLRRARETAETVSRRLGTPPVFFLDGLRERNWGLMEGRPRAEALRHATPEGGEGPEDFRDRTRRALAAVAGPGPALIVAHSGTAREIHALLGLAFERPDNCDILHFRPESACHWIVTKL